MLSAHRREKNSRLLAEKSMMVQLMLSVGMCGLDCWTQKGRRMETQLSKREEKDFVKKIPASMWNAALYFSQESRKGLAMQLFQAPFGKPAQLVLPR